MRCENIDRDNFELYSEMIPGDLDEILFQKNIHSFGAVFAETPVGAVVWSEDEEDSYGRLMSIFVAPEARRLGVGTFLLEAVAKEMEAAGKEGITFKYSESGERRLLTLFFNISGFETDSFELPVGRISFLEAAKALKALPGSEKEAGTPVSKLAVKDRNALLTWIRKMSPENATEYSVMRPESFAVLDGGEVKGALLFSKEDESTLSLDYAYSSDPKSLIGMLILALKTLAADYSKDTVIEMLLATDSGRGLYEKLFGPTEFFCKITECRQSFV